MSIAGVISKPISKEALHLLVGDGSECDQLPWVEEQSAYGEVFEITRQDLQNALDRHEFVLVYQPKIECKSGALAGFEALIRWWHGDNELVMPDLFISIAEEAGLIDAVTEQIFHQSIKWFSESFPESDLKLSINISAKGLVDIHQADNLYELCRQYKVAPERVVLELTESSAMVDSTLSLDLMTRFRVKGFHLSIDDFGT